MSDKRIKQLKFVASMFKMSMDEFNNVMGPEPIQTIFRLIGENQGTAIEKRLKEKYKVDSWTPEQLSELLIKDVFEPAIGEDSAEINVAGNEMIVKIKTCPFSKAGLKIDDKFYCTYTQGLIDTISKLALKDTEFKTELLRSDGKDCCQFKVVIT